MSKLSKTIGSATLIFVITLGIFALAKNVSAEPGKEYRSGQVVTINSKNYLIVNNKEFAEIIEITAGNKLTQVSEVHGMGKIEDLYSGEYLNKYFLVVATGQYLYRYDISDPKAPKIEFKRDMYTFKRGQFKIGSIDILAGNKDYLFGAGSNGVRSFLKDSLFFYKIYTFDKSYGLVADNERLYVITENKGIVYNIASGEKLVEVELENKEKMNRSPYFDNSGNVYFPSDNGLIKINIVNKEKKSYFNPVSKTENYSYSVTVLSNGDVYYVNGHGVTVLNKSFNKTKFLTTAKGDLYGANSWSVGITSAKIGKQEIIVCFNKSSILLLDNNLKLLSQYKYKKLYSGDFVQDLKVIPSTNSGSAGQTINLKFYGFWPNETVAVTFGKNSYSVKVDNQGYASHNVVVPSQDNRQAVIQAIGDDSKFSYQTSFIIL